MDERARRLGENEALFRSVNEQIDRLTRTQTITTNEMDVVCECADETCLERIRLGFDEYKSVRADPANFVVAPGHVAPSVESVVDGRQRYWIVHKHEGGPAELARALDELA